LPNPEYGLKPNAPSGKIGIRPAIVGLKADLCVPMPGLIGDMRCWPWAVDAVDPSVASTTRHITPIRLADGFISTAEEGL